MSKRSRGHRGGSSRSQQKNYAETVLSWGVFDNDDSTFHYNQLLHHPIDHGAVIDWDFLATDRLENAFLESFKTDAFTGPQWERLFRMQETVYNVLVREFLATYYFEVGVGRSDVGATSVYFRLRGKVRSCSILALGWRLGLYSQHVSTQALFMHLLSQGVTVKNDMRSTEF